MRSNDIALMLPEIWRRGLSEGSVTQVLIEVMARLHGSVEAAIADPALLVDPRRAPDRLLQRLAAWVGLAPWLDTTASGGKPDPADLRELTAIAAALARNRGNAGSLIRFLEVATGVGGFEIVEDETIPFHFHLTIPVAALPRHALILRIVTAEKPAFTTFETHPPTCQGDTENGQLPDQ